MQKSPVPPRRGRATVGLMLANATLVEIRIHPVKAEPAVVLERVEVEADGLAQDRRKKAAVHLVGEEDAATTRANLVLSIPAASLGELTGQVLAIGEVRLGVLGAAGNCAGVYAEVLTTGSIARGDAVTAIAP